MPVSPSSCFFPKRTFFFQLMKKAYLQPWRHFRKIVSKDQNAPLLTMNSLKILLYILCYHRWKFGSMYIWQVLCCDVTKLDCISQDVFLEIDEVTLQITVFYYEFFFFLSLSLSLIYIFIFLFPFIVSRFITKITCKPEGKRSICIYIYFLST